jgi:DNA-binding CsgD family transcriptional regulator
MHGETAMFSINSHVTDAEWAKIKKEYMRDFQILAHHFHTHILESLGVDENATVHFTNREIECLKWAAAGKSVWETSRILGITERTVSLYLETARTKIGAVNKTQAVAKAIRENLI